MNRNKERIWVLVCVVFAVAVVLFALSDIAMRPWHIMTQLGSDGGKNNFTYLYHSLYGKGVWFEGMNYPYGEHIVYTDGQPLLSVPLSYFKGYVSVPLALGLMYGLISFSYFLSIIFIYKILRQFSVATVIAMLFAGFITVCSPQILRLSGHYALSYCCVIPMLFYWSLKYFSTNAKKYLAYIFLLGAFMVFMHPYFAAMELVWVCCYSIGYFMSGKKNFSTVVSHLVPLLASVAGVFILFGLFIKFTDPATDRPATPYGILANCTKIPDIISSNDSPFWIFLHKHGICSHITGGGEGYAYLGATALIVLFISAVSALVSLLRKTDKTSVDSSIAFQRVSLFIAISSLVFSMGIPFIWRLEWLTGYFSVLKQFRTLGRFSWISYYVLTVFASVKIYAWYARFIAGRKPAVAYLILLAAFGTWAVEASAYIKTSRSTAAQGYELYDVFLSSGEQSWEQFLSAHNRKGSDFQAILTFPFFEIGSEKLWVGESLCNFGMAISAQAGIQLHLPVVDVMMSRTSWSQAFKQVKISGGPYIDKPLLRDLKSDKPFLFIIVDRNTMTPDEKYLLESSDTIGHISHYFICACYPSRIRANDKQHADSISAVLPALRTGDTCVSGHGSWFIAHFDSARSGHTFFGSGALSYSPAPLTTVATIMVKPAADSQLYELSCWFLVPADNYKSPNINAQLLDSAGNTIGSVDGITSHSIDNYGLWLWNNRLFNIPSACRSVRCRIVEEQGKSYLAMDELMLRPADALIISKDSKGNVMVNNHRFKNK